MKKFGRGPSYQYLVRLLTTKNKSGDTYGLTIPSEVVKKYNLFHKKFKLKVSPKGKYILYVKMDGKVK